MFKAGESEVGRIFASCVEGSFELALVEIKMSSVRARLEDDISSFRDAEALAGADLLVAMVEGCVE